MIRTTELSTDEVLLEEICEVHFPRSADPAVPLYTTLNRLGSAALCLSGGGIRSAAFALGVIQALTVHPRPNPKEARPVASAEQSLLSKFHYLSTVSGGGYIGSWLSAWLISKPYSEIWRALTGHPHGPSEEAPSISWLRSYSNYLTPKIGLTSADTWAALAMWMRNLLLNWFVILPPICLFILLVKLVGVSSTWLIIWGEKPDFEGQYDLAFYGKLVFEIGAGVCAIAALTVALWFTLRGRPGLKNLGDGPNQRQFVWRSLFWSMLSAFLLVHFFASDFVGLSLLECKGPPITLKYWPLPICQDIDKPLNAWLTTRYSLVTHMTFGAIGGFLIYGLAWLLAWPRKVTNWDILPWAVSGAVFGVMAAAALHAYLITPDTGLSWSLFGGNAAIGNAASTPTAVPPPSLQVYFLHLVFGVPWLLLSRATAEMTFVGLSSYEKDGDADREWLGRSGGWLIAVAVVWLVVTFCIYFGTIIIAITEGLPNLGKVGSYSSLVAGVSGLLTAIFGSSSSTTVQGATKGPVSYAISLILPVLAVLFGVALLVALSILLDIAFFRESLLPDNIEGMDWAIRFFWLFGGISVSFLLVLLSSFTVNINRFSLHALYRNRLVRAFLGASRDRVPDPFTGFDQADNPEMAKLRRGSGPAGWRPFQVINIALNIVSTDDHLAWQERKAAPFTATPLHTGSSLVGYRRTNEYGGPLSLGTAMAISGAAASPNMGYHSSPAITFLMTLFNVRLGWWFGNPGTAGEGTYSNEGPRFALKPLVQEAFGLTTADKAYVYLSDGGHFENLGLYEMIRRRCRFILVSDAGCDPHFKFADLADAARKITIDFGVSIRFYGLEKLRPRPGDDSDVGPDQPYHSIGEIDYQSADGPDAKNGIVLYVKAGYHGIESAGIRGYAKANPEFPHQSTIDQWFTESQFESYRALGFEVLDGILNKALAEPECGANPDLERIFGALQKLMVKDSSGCSSCWS